MVDQTPVELKGRIKHPITDLALTTIRAGQDWREKAHVRLKVRTPKRFSLNTQNSSGSVLGGPFKAAPQR